MSTPPFYRLTRRPLQQTTAATLANNSSNTSDNTENNIIDSQETSAAAAQLLDKRHIHAKRQSAGDDPAKLASMPELSVPPTCCLCFCLTTTAPV